MKNILGISAGFHDAAISVVSEQGDILFAGHSERYSGVKNDPSLHPDLLRECCNFYLDEIAFYERPWLHNWQQFVSGQHHWGPWTTGQAIRQHLGDGYHFGQRQRSWPHHLSHAAAGFQTSPFQEAAVVVIDAIGEMDTISIFRAWYNDQGQARYQRVWRQGYPHSIGLFYSAITRAVGLKPMEEEYITMGMAAYGEGWRHQNRMTDMVVADLDTVTLRRNLHTGFDEHEFALDEATDVAAAAQHLAERLIRRVIQRAREMVASDNLVYMGGVALNCVANARIGDIYENIWIMPNPGDAGSSLGAAALSHGGRLRWRDAYLGHDIPGPYPVDRCRDHLLSHGIVGVASGRAEFGPRALGNRSLLADPRGARIKDQVNEIKRRQKFRPFAPAILEEHVSDYFVMPHSYPISRYMQVVAQVRDPVAYPAITHVDHTARVQTVPADGSGFRRLLEAWYARTRCPMLLNTSLNIRGEPMVNDRADADRFEQLYNIKVFS